MTTVPKTPDPFQGAAIDALGSGLSIIYMPNDDENVRAAIVRLPAEMIADWAALTRLSVPSRPIQISSGIASFSLERLRYHWVDTPSGGATVYTTPSTIPPGGFVQGETMELAIYDLNVGQTVDIQRPGGESIVLFNGAPGGIYAFCRLKYLGSSFKLQEATSDGVITWGVQG